ncbi:MAG: hypothetical protein M9887_03440 [Chitinophagales bacterium]|nr:hypothetical protein [Chitinophagales bacterium]
MRTLKFYFLSIVMAVFLMSCKSSKSLSETTTIEKSMKGLWNIEYVNCCFRNAVTTYGGKQSIEFNTKKKTYRLINSDGVLQKGAYSITKGELGTMLNLLNQPPALIKVQDDHLVIDWSYMDLSLNVYKRP